MAERLKIIGELVTFITASITEDSDVTIGSLLKQVYDTELLILDPRLISYLDPEAPVPVQSEPRDAAGDEDDQGDDDSEKELASMGAFLACPASQLLAYHNYILERSPFWTQQGIKGAEFNRVLVVLDDAEGTHNQFSYEKYLGLQAPSDTDLNNLKEGKETVVDRTRRLFYVSCTRALKDLAVVLFTGDPVQAEPHIRQLNLFENEAIHTEAAFDAV
jgi:DNA helicase-2/ATP-dependent DNA helicase PcrA